jgi:hypothetical protein
LQRDYWQGFSLKEMVVPAVRLSTHEVELLLRIREFRALVAASLLSMGEGFVWVALFAF